MNELISQRAVSQPATSPTGMAAATRSRFSRGHHAGEGCHSAAGGAQGGELDGAFGEVDRQRVEQHDEGEDRAEEQHDADDGVEEAEQLADGRFAAADVAERDDAG